MAGDTTNVGEDIEIRIDPDPFCTSCQIYSMNKKSRAKIPLNPKANIIPSTAPKRLTSENNFNKYLLIVDDYSKIPKLYGMGKK